MGFDFRQWVSYFNQNKANLQHIEWHAPYMLSASEYHTILRSVQQFQVGERSEGKFLVKSAKRYLSHSKDDSLSKQQKLNNWASNIRKNRFPRILLYRFFWSKNDIVC